jgi:hypothetical protein
MNRKSQIYMNMKSKLQMRAATILFLFIASVIPVLAQPKPSHATDNTPEKVHVIDPATGLPPVLPHPVVLPDWKDPDWKDPDKVLPEVSYEGLPLGEIARNLRDQFKSHFDVLLPGDDSHNIPINLRLKDVTASEVFNAMNLVFENDKIPLRWELKMNGHRPTALLRELAESKPVLVPEPPAEEPKRTVFFVGDLIGDEKSGGMTMDQLSKTISEVYQLSFPGNVGLQFHKAAQLVIITGTPDQLNFVHVTLEALRDKVRLDAERNTQSKAVESKPKSGETKPH